MELELPWHHYFNLYGWIIIIPFLERLFPTRKQFFFRKGVATDLLYSIVIFVGIPAAYANEFLLDLFLNKHYFFQNIFHEYNLIVNLLVLTIISEITFYAAHRLLHESNLLWEFHRVHHSSEHYDSFMLGRIHFVDILFTGTPLVLIGAYLGISTEAWLYWGAFSLFMDRYGHSNIKGPRFHSFHFITTPLSHSWHHSNDVKNCNYSRHFPFLDYLFGTAYYPRNEYPSHFGEKNYTHDFFYLQMSPFVEIKKKFRKVSYKSIDIIREPYTLIPQLEILRFFLASIVVICHFNEFNKTDLFLGQYATNAVSLFFIMSGFILSLRYQNLSLKISDLKSFFLKRLIRVYPAYFLSIVLSLIVLLYGISIYNTDYINGMKIPLITSYNLPKNIELHTIYTSLYEHLFFIQILSNNDFSKFILNPPLWSIVDEMFFYLIFPFILPLMKYKKTLYFSLFRVLIVCTIQFLLIYYISNSIINLDWEHINSPIYMNPLLRCFEFFLGMALYPVFLNVKDYRIPSYMAVNALIIQVIFFNWVKVEYKDINIIYSLYFITVPLGFTIILTTLFINYHKTKQYLIISSFLGSLSYLIYVFHWPLLNIMAIFDYKIFNSTVLNFLFNYLIIIIISTLIYLGFEKLIRKKLRSSLAIEL